MGQEIINNEKESRFEYLSGGSVSVMDYRKENGTYYLDHAEVPEGLEGEGLGSELMEKLLKYIEENKETFVANCTFAQKYVKQHPEWDRLLKRD
jgi:uncharacterized protein